MCLGFAYEAGHVQEWDLHRGYQIHYVSKGSKKIDMRCKTISIVVQDNFNQPTFNVRVVQSAVQAVHI